MRKNTATTSPTSLYWEATISPLPRTLEPALTLWLFKGGCWGTQEKLDFEQMDLRYLPKVRLHPFISLNSYFDLPSKEKIEGLLLKWLGQRAPMTKVQWELKVSEDWLKEWKKHFKSFALAGLRIIPAWEAQKNSKQKNRIIINPGMAFGTGTHTTTQFATRMLKKISKRLKKKSLLDVGAGSGILCVAAEKFGASSCLAIDNDPESWRECRKTFKLNSCRRSRVTSKQLNEVKKQYDVVVANIIDGVLMDLKKDLWRVTKAKGLIILSGILTDRAKAFKKNFLSGTDGRVVHEISDGEWTSFLISK